MDVSTDLIAREILEVIPAVMGTIRSEMRSRRSSELNVMQFRALVYINQNPGTSLSSLAEYLGLTLPTVSQMIDGMVRHGFVTRQESIADRRCLMLSLTTRGADVLDNAFTGTRQRLAHMLARLSMEECQTVHQSLILLEDLFCQSSSAHEMKWVNVQDTAKA